MKVNSNQPGGMKCGIDVVFRLTGTDSDVLTLRMGTESDGAYTT